MRVAHECRKTWGESVLVNVGLGAAFSLLLLGSLPILALAMVGGVMLMGSSQAAGIAVMVGALVVVVLYWLTLAIIHSITNR